MAKSSPIFKPYWESAVLFENPNPIKISNKHPGSEDRNQRRAEQNNKSI